MTRNTRITAILIILITLVIYSLTRPATEIQVVEVDDAAIEGPFAAPDNYLDSYMLLDYLYGLNIKYPKVVLAQAWLESAKFLSDNFREYNNIFGMKRAYRRPTTSFKSSDSSDYAIYGSWQESALDYALYQSFIISKVSSEQEYLDYLGKHYAEDSNYVGKLISIMNSPDFPNVDEIELYMK